ncbi:hypothetical protein ABW20_dc0106743 [Dactylellina cionopaga]|nr:hypothetical protein ABW20_dc0106743 [Dactylellina cionopaga]
MGLLSDLLFPVTFASVAAIVAGSPLTSEWRAPGSTWINNLTRVLEDDGVHGFIFSGSKLPKDVEYGRYNWCNMPHVHPSTYQVPPKMFELVYVEVIHRHHKRTPYQDNTFPLEDYPWDCSDQGLFLYGTPLGTNASSSAQVYWKIEESPINPFHAPGFKGNCQFPQITRDGLDDSWRHGNDLFNVYGAKLKFLPQQPDEQVVYRVTSNPITSQVAGMVIKGMFSSAQLTRFPLSLQPALVDSLQPSYTCPKATTLYSTYSTGSRDPEWLLHLTKSRSLFRQLDLISGVPADDDGFHKSFDHYFDNLSARQCHQKQLPCSQSDSDRCITQNQADFVYRMGQYEYSYIYRDMPQSLDAAVGSYGVWVAELAHNIRARISGESPVKYRHNIAHDGSISRLLSILQLNVMVWPGMGAEVVFEVYRQASLDKYSVRVLWGGQPLESSHPALGKIDMIDLEVLLGYLEGLVGRRAEKVAAFCSL